MIVLMGILKIWNRYQRLTDSVVAAADAAQQVIDRTVNRHMTGIDSSISQFEPNDPPPLEPLTLAFTNPSDAELEVSCDNRDSIASIRPSITSSDSRCPTSSLTPRKFATTTDVPSEYPCGTIKFTRRWSIRDSCNRMAYVDQIVYLTPSAPTWTRNPWSEPVSDVIVITKCMI